MNSLTLHNILLESGTLLPTAAVDYSTWGDRSDSVAVVMHALTGNTDAVSWWNGIVGPERFIDTEQYFVVCPRIRFEEFAKDLPLLTTRDVVRIYDLVLDALQITQVEILIGGSMGGQFALEWGMLRPDRFVTIVTIAANAQPSAWGIAIRSAQRMAIEADPTFGTNDEQAGGKGLAAARAIGMLSYRTYDDYRNKQSDSDERLTEHSAESYQRYQGQKLVERFRADVYHMLTRTMDSHNIGRGRGGVERALASITAHTIVVGIDQDILMPTHEQKFIAQHIPNAYYVEMHSSVGHDAFLADQPQLASLLEHAFKYWSEGKPSDRQFVKSSH